MDVGAASFCRKREVAPPESVWEHPFVTSQGSAYVRFRRALDAGNPTIALAAAAELDFVSLPYALELVLLLVDEPARFRRAALRWHARYCGELQVSASRKPTPCWRASPALRVDDLRPRRALAELVHRRGLERARLAGSSRVGSSG